LPYVCKYGEGFKQIPKIPPSGGKNTKAPSNPPEGEVKDKNRSYGKTSALRGDALS